jgi:hypothetical protein
MPVELLFEEEQLHFEFDSPELCPAMGFSR